MHAFLLLAELEINSKAQSILDSLKDFSSLTELHVNGLDLNKDDVPHLAQKLTALPKIRVLDLGNNMFLPCDLRHVLISTPLLEDLCVDKNILTEVGSHSLELELAGH